MIFKENLTEILDGIRPFLLPLNSYKPIHDSQKNISGSEEEKLRRTYPTLSKGRFFSIDCKENYELIRELTSFGKELIVLTPIMIRKKIENRITEMVDNYKSLEIRT